MKYPEKMLSEGEAKVFETHYHPVVLVKSFLPVLLFTGLWLAGLFTVEFLRERWMVVIGFALFAVLAAVAAWRLIVWLHVILALTDRRLVFQSGVFSRRSREIPLSKITDVSSYQSVSGRILGTGDLVVESESESGPVPFFNIPHPERLKATILSEAHGSMTAFRETADRSLVEDVARAVQREQPTHEITPLPPERPPLYSEIVDQLERLDGLRKRGVVSEEEFEKAKASLLKRLEGEE